MSQIATGVEELGAGRFLVQDEHAFDTATIYWLNEVYGDGPNDGPDRVVESKPTRYPCEILCTADEVANGTVALITVINL